MHRLRTSQRDHLWPNMLSIGNCERVSEKYSSPKVNILRVLKASVSLRMRHCRFDVFVRFNTDECLDDECGNSSPRFQSMTSFDLSVYRISVK